MSAVAARAPAVEYSDEQLRAAWNVCRLDTWPRTFEETMTDPARARLVRLHAWHLAHPNKRPAAPSTCSSARSPSARALPTTPQLPLGLRAYDVKRAAGGDRDD